MGDQLKTQRWWVDKALSLAANKSLLHELFSGRGGRRVHCFVLCMFIVGLFFFGGGSNLKHKIVVG